jgi:predicted nucleic acid-binding protein
MLLAAQYNLPPQADSSLDLLKAKIVAQVVKMRPRFNVNDLGVTALHLGYSVATLNSRHFQLIPGLSIVQL